MTANPPAWSSCRSLLVIAGLATTVWLSACGGGGGSGGGRAVVDRCASQSVERAAVLASNTPTPTDFEDILRYGFEPPVVTEWLLNPAIRRTNDVRALNDGIFMFSEGFDHAYECVELSGATQIASLNNDMKAVRVDYSYRGTSYSALAYGEFPGGCGYGSAALVIPGSGNNQATAAVTRRTDNYHFGVMDALAPVDQTYVLVKPNEDALAWHNGMGAKLAGDMVWNYHVNRGGSYSVSYLVHSLAFVKWMKSCFSQTVVAGVSQGGAATLLNALQSSPTAAVVAAGHSLLFDQIEYGGHNQLLNVPGYAGLFKSTALLRALSESPSLWLFAWGLADTDYYKVEAATGYTAGVIGPLPNVDISIHEGGHVFPVADMRNFLKAILDQ